MVKDPTVQEGTAAAYEENNNPSIALISPFGCHGKNGSKCRTDKRENSQTRRGCCISTVTIQKKLFEEII